MEFRFLSLVLGVLGEGSTRICLGGHLCKLIGTAFTTVESDPCLSLGSYHRATGCEVSFTSKSQEDSEVNVGPKTWV